MFRNTRFLGFILLFFLVSCQKEKSFEKYIPAKIDYAWMTSLLNQYPDKDIKFSDISLPGSHDAGVYILRKCSFGANACNTQTQHLDMGKQLKAGYRIFDVRPMILNGEYYAHHTTECGGLGCQGDYIKNIFEYTNDFLEEYHEIVVLSFGHFCNMNENDEQFLKMLQEVFGDKIYKETERVNYFYDWSLRKILGENPATGKVILMFDSGFSNTDENRKQGYFSSSIMNTVGGWSNKSVYSQLKEDQLLKFNNYSPAPSRLFQFSWQMTQETAQAVACAVGDQSNSILSFSKQSNPDFQIVIDSMVQSGAINSHKYPHIFWLDHGDEWMISIAKTISEIGIAE